MCGRLKQGFFVAQREAGVNRVLVITWSLKRAAAPWKFNLFWKMKDSFSPHLNLNIFYSQKKNQCIHEY